MPCAHRLVLVDDAAIAHAPEEVGGKAATLARLRLDQYPVPKLFSITTTAFRLHLRQNAMLPHRGGDHADSPEATRATIDSAPLPDPLIRAICEAYVTWDEPTVAVRSSGVTEDGRSASYAGIFESFLGVRGSSLLLNRMRSCWSSYFNPRVSDYRTALQQPTEEFPLMGVAVQQQIFPARAGVLFTRHPLNPQASLAYLECNFGTGESVVGGLVTPDALTMSRETGEVVSATIPRKELMTVIHPQGRESRTVAVPDSLAPTRVISDAEALELTQLGLKIEGTLGAPQDIEWAIDDAQIWVVQARPITR